MTTTIISILIIAALLLLTPIVILTLSVHLMPRAKLTEMNDEEAEHEREAGETSLGADWLQQHGFVWGTRSRESEQQRG